MFVDSTLNKALPKVGRETLDFDGRQASFYEVVYSVTRMFNRFERAGFLVEYEGGSFADCELPKITVMKGTHKMAKNKSTLGEWNGIAKVAFNNPERRKYDDWIKTKPDIELEVGELIGQDYKVSFSHDSRSGAVMCSVSCYAASSPNYKYTLISRAPTFWDALAVSIFKHTVLADGVWTEAETEDDMWG